MSGAVKLPVAAASATLRRHGTVRATGAARLPGGEIRVTLNAARPLPPERYTLSLTYTERDLKRRHTNNVVGVER